MSGIPKAKLVPASALDDMVSEGAGFAGFAAGDVGQGPHDPDLVSIPDMQAMIVLPWRKNIAWVPGMLQVENQPSKYCPAQNSRPSTGDWPPTRLRIDGGGGAGVHAAETQPGWRLRALGRNG